jgi:hypothetical protein
MPVRELSANCQARYIGARPGKRTIDAVASIGDLMETHEHDAAVTGEEVSSHATTPGAALAGAVTGGVIGLSCGPVGAAFGAAGGAIVGALSERLLHGGEDE